jgi:hypothetical protein
MLVRNLIISGLALAGLSFLAWQIGVRQSRMILRSDKVHFPTVSGSNLDRQEFEFPRDFAGQLNLLFIPFLQDQQTTVNTWISFAQELETTTPGFVYYELPTIDEMPMLARTFINEGMRAGIPDPKARVRTITLYIDTHQFRQALDIPSKNDVHILLVDQLGDILWRTTGNFDASKAVGSRDDAWI